jgi:hypothetical protein
MNAVEVLLARSQVRLAYLYGIGFIGLIFVIIFWHKELDKDSYAMLTGLAGVLGTIATQQNGYFFQRQRPHNPMDNGDDPLDPAAKPPQEQEK